MTEADDNVVGLPDLDRLFEEVLAGEIGTADAPAWRNDLARLVHGARAEAAPDELAARGRHRAPHGRRPAGGQCRRPGRAR